MRKLLYILTFLFLSFTFHSMPPSGGWYQQWLPDINNRPISDVTFLDSLTGFAVTPYTANDTAYILKTTNGGDNWIIVFKGQTNIIGGFNAVKFLNLNTGYVCGNFLRKTTNGGFNWFQMNTSGIFPENMYVLNEDTIWLIDSEGLTGGVFRTTNGGLNWTRQLNLGSQNPTHIYFYNKDIGYTADNILYKTTNSGTNWFQISGGGYSDMYFVNESTGWKCTGSNMRKTTNGGLNWQLLPLPPEVGNIVLSRVIRFDNLNADTIWGVGSVGIVGSGLRGLLYITTNGGDNWGYQLPDTAIHSGQYQYIQFIDKLHGWAYWLGSGVHTITGGDTTIYLGVHQISSEIPKDYTLFQNYPNPFNSKTIISYEIRKKSNVRLDVFDMQGKEIMTLVKQEQGAGKYQVDFPGAFFSSGVYFYRLSADGNVVETKKMLLIK